VKAAVAALDGLAVALALGAAVIIVTGGFTVAGIALSRPEDLVVAATAVVAVRALLRPIRLPAWAPRRVVLAGVAVYAVVFSFISLARHFAFQSHALDLGYYIQVVWSIGAGRGAYVSLPEMHAWGDHFSPVLYLFVPIAWIVSAAAPLLIGQSLILAAGGFAVFALARWRLGDPRLAAGFALLYLINPSLHGINLRDVHPQAFAIPLLVAAAYAVERDRYGWCALALAAAAAGREDAAVAIVGFGVWLALARRKWLAGAGVAAAAIALLIVDVRWLMPYFLGRPYTHFGRYSQLGDSLEQILLAPVLRPGALLASLVTVANARYLVLLLAPFGFLPLLAPRVLAVAGPGLAINLLSLDPVLRVPRSQYVSFILPFLVLAAIDGYAALARMAGGRRLAGRFSPALALAVAAFASIALTARTVNELTVSRWWPTGERRAAHRVIAQVPPMVPVAANERFVPHLARRPEVFRTKEDGLTRGEWVVEYEHLLRRTDGFEVVARGGGVVLLRALQRERG
jgi:uncharacterized membrane protein